MSKPRRILAQVFHTGVMPGPFHFIRSRLIPAEPRLCWEKIGGEWCRTNSSIDAMVNMRAGLDKDFTPVEPREDDITPPWPSRNRGSWPHTTHQRKKGR